MSPDFAVQIVRQAFMSAFWLALPLLAVGFIAGLVMSLVQIVTSIQDSAFSTVPRLVAFLAVLLISMPWLLQKAMAYMVAIFGDLARYAR
jgi:flagellar biosynthesis protein FliQ